MNFVVCCWSCSLIQSHLLHLAFVLFVTKLLVELKEICFSCGVEDKTNFIETLVEFHLWSSFIWISNYKTFSATPCQLDFSFNLCSQFLLLDLQSRWTRFQWPGHLRQVVQEVWCVWLVVKWIRSLFCTCAVAVAAAFEGVNHGSVAGCGQWHSWDRDFSSHPPPWSCGQQKCWV